MTYKDRLAAIIDGFEARRDVSKAPAPLEYSTYQRDGWTLNLSVVPVVNDDDLIAITIMQDGTDGKTFMIETEKLRTMLAKIGIIEDTARIHTCPTEPWDT